MIASERTRRGSAWLRAVLASWLLVLVACDGPAYVARPVAYVSIDAAPETPFTRLSHDESGIEWARSRFSASDLHAVVDLAQGRGAPPEISAWLAEVTFALRTYYDGQGFFSGEPGLDGERQRAIAE